MPELNEVSMAEGKRKPADNAEQIDEYAVELLDSRLPELKLKYPEQAHETLGRGRMLRTGFLSFDECQLAPEPSFNFKSGEICGLVQFGKGTLHLERPSTKEPELASHALILMFTSCCTEVSFPVAQFHTRNLTAEKLVAISNQVAYAMTDVCGIDLINLNADGCVKLSFIPLSIANSTINPPFQFLAVLMP